MKRRVIAKRLDIPLSQSELSAFSENRKQSGLSETAYARFLLTQTAPLLSASELESNRYLTEVQQVILEVILLEKEGFQPSLFQRAMALLDRARLLNLKQKSRRNES